MNIRSAESKELLKRRGGIDPAALAAASLASAVSTIGQPGPYTSVTAIVGVTILFVVLAYDIEAYRSMFQSIAYSSVAGLSSILACGYLLELYYRRPDIDAAASAVPAESSLVGWAVVSVIYFSFDRPARRRWSEIAA